MAVRRRGTTVMGSGREDGPGSGGQANQDNAGPFQANQDERESIYNTPRVGSFDQVLGQEVFGAGRGGESPRERETERTSQLRQPGGAVSMPRSPSTPSPAAAGGGLDTPGVPPIMPPAPPQPFPPLPAPQTSSLVSPAKRGLYGGQGGLTGGGLGVPLDPVADEESDPITTLIKMLSGGR